MEESAARSARGDRHLWVPRLAGNERLLLALVLDRDDGHPDNTTATACTFGVDRETVRRWRDLLLDGGLAVQRRGYLVGTDAARELLRRSDPLPRALLRGRGAKPSPSVLRACALVYSDAIGWRADRRGCRTDAERAELAGVSRETIVAARQLLAERDLVGVEAVRRGRADLRRARLTDDRRATHGSPMAAGRAEVLAQRAERGRARPRGGAVPADSEGAVPADTPMQSLRGTLPMQAPAAPAADGDGVAALRDGAAERAAAAAALDRIRAVDVATVDRLRRMPNVRGIEQVLELAGVHDLAPRRRSHAADMLDAAGRDAIDVLAIAADVVAGNARSPGAVIAKRLPQLLNRGRTVSDVLTRCRRNCTLEQLLAAARGETVPAKGGRRRRVVEPADHSAHPAVVRMRNRMADAAIAGDWRGLSLELASSAAREQRVDVAAVSTWSDVPENTISEGLAGVPRVALGRRATA